MKVVSFVRRIGKFYVYSGILGLAFVGFSWEYMRCYGCG